MRSAFATLAVALACFLVEVPVDSLARVSGAHAHAPQRALHRRSDAGAGPLRMSKRAKLAEVALLAQAAASPEKCTVKSSSDKTKKVNNAKKATTTKKAATTTKTTKMVTTTKKAAKSTTEAKLTTDSFGFGDGFLKSNGIYIGFLPDNGDSGGSPQSIESVDASIGAKSFSVGLYAHCHPDTPFDGTELTDLGASQLTGNSGLGGNTKTKSEVDYKAGALLDQVVQSGSVFIASVMPIYGWGGLTSDNNTQAVRIAQVLKKFTDKGVKTWLRFGHEMNWYQSPGSGNDGGQVYYGGASDWQMGWATVAAAIQQIAPEVKMYWSPNIGSPDSISPYWPTDESTVDVVGIDWYPDTDDADIVSTVGWMHDQYASATRPFTLGETGSTDDLAGRQELLRSLTTASVAAALPHFKALAWFNYDKGSNFMLGGPGCTDNGATCSASDIKAFFKSIQS